MRETEQDEKNRLLQIAQICRHDKDKLDAIADILDEEGLGTLGYYVTGAAYNLYEAVCDACGIEIEDEEEESSPATANTVLNRRAEIISGLREVIDSGKKERAGLSWELRLAVSEKNSLLEKIGRRDDYIAELIERLDK